MTGQQMPSLTEKLAERQQQQLDAVEKLTSEQLARLAQSMTQHTSAALSTTQSDIDRLRESIRSSSASCWELSAGLEQTLQKIEQQAKRCEISESMQQQIREQLQQQISRAQGAAIQQSLKPLQQTLKQIEGEAQALSKTSARAWLKPLAIGASASTGVLIVAILGTLGIDSLISNRLQRLADVQQQISAAEQLKQSLPAGARLERYQGQWYLISQQLGSVRTLEDGTQAVSIGRRE